MTKNLITIKNRMTSVIPYLGIWFNANKDKDTTKPALLDWLNEHLAEGKQVYVNLSISECNNILASKSGGRVRLYQHVEDDQFEELDLNYVLAMESGCIDDIIYAVTYAATGVAIDFERGKDWRNENLVF